MPAPDSPQRLQVAGKYFSRGGRKVYLSGLTYGPFGPGQVNGGLHDPASTMKDLAQLRSMGANSLRLYHAPPEWFLDLCAEHDLHVTVSLPWMDHVDFLSSRQAQQQVLHNLATEARRLSQRPEIDALLVGNEINTTLVRWLGPRRVLRFLEDLIDATKQAGAETLVAYASYPSTEYLLPENADFAAYNLYLEDRTALTSYLARLQNLAGDRPLVITEFGIDTKSHGLDKQAEILAWERDVASAAGVAGNFVFAYTDEWHRGGEAISGWDFGIVNRDREPKPSYRKLQQTGPLSAPHLPVLPSMSVLVCTRNGSRTLEECLASLEKISYPNYEIIVVDDGSTDQTRQIIQAHPQARYLFQEPAGLSVARNTAANYASGEILVYTDDDCVVDPDWLTYLALAFQDPKVAAAGGPNIPPPPQNLAQACVIAAPGGPAHVLLTDTTAEHLPGCNLAVRKSAFTEVGGFLPKYHAAGDDVDFCWRLSERGLTIAFHPGAMVWHYRRFSIKAYLKQQIGYGKAEGLLLGQHSHRFGHFGGARWRGTVYQSALLQLTRQSGRIYSGSFGHAPFQIIYAAPLSDYFHLASSFPWLLISVALMLNFTWNTVLGWTGLAMLALSLVLPLRQVYLLRLPAHYAGPRARLLLWFLLVTQPVVRNLSRFYWGLRSGGAPTGPIFNPRPSRFARLGFPKRVAELTFWSPTGQDREGLLAALETALTHARIPHQSDDGWRNWDLEMQPNFFWAVRLTTVTEYHQKGATLTRLRLATRATVANLVLNFLLIITVLSVIFTCSTKTALITLGAFLCWLFLLELLHRHTARSIAKFSQTQATSLGLEPTKTPQA